MSKLYTSTCPQCSKVFKRSSQGAANLAMYAHRRRAHSGKPPLTEAEKNAKKQVYLRTWRAKRKARIAAGELAPQTPARKQRKVRGAEVAVNFCPACGCNLQAVATGLIMGRLA